MKLFLKIAMFANCPRCGLQRGYAVPNTGAPPIMECVQCNTRFQS